MYEIERKFLIKNNIVEEPDEIHEILQAYVMIGHDRSLRIRSTDDETFTLTVKVKGASISTIEVENSITRDEFNVLWKKSFFRIHKMRRVYGRWEVDSFLDKDGNEKPVRLAEIELAHEKEDFELPYWVGEEVTGNPDYYNVNIGKS